MQSNILTYSRLREGTTSDLKRESQLNLQTNMTKSFSKFSIKPRGHFKIILSYLITRRSFSTFCSFEFLFSYLNAGSQLQNSMFKFQFDLLSTLKTTCLRTTVLQKRLNKTKQTTTKNLSVVLFTFFFFFFCMCKSLLIPFCSLSANNPLHFLFL